MAKKRKLNSKNPKYMTKEKDDSPKIKEKKLICVVNPTDEKTGKKNMKTEIPVYAVWYEDDN